MYLRLFVVLVGRVLPLIAEGKLKDKAGPRYIHRLGEGGGKCTEYLKLEVF